MSPPAGVVSESVPDTAMTAHIFGLIFFTPDPGPEKVRQQSVRGAGRQSPAAAWPRPTAPRRHGQDQDGVDQGGDGDQRGQWTPVRR